MSGERYMYNNYENNNDNNTINNDNNDNISGQIVPRQRGTIALQCKKAEENEKK